MVDVNALKGLRIQLDEEKERVERQIAGLTDSGLGESLSTSIGEVSAYDNHPADLGSETFERSKDFALRENARIILSNINRAYRKMDDGTYGTCENCKRDIPLERLEALPYAALCIECKEREEDVSDTSGRPVEEEVLDPAFMRFDQDKEDSVIYDGEDAWQEVARYGSSNSPQDEPPATSMSGAYTDSDEVVGSVSKVDALIDPKQEKSFNEVIDRVSIVQDLRRTRKRRE
jgi:YteA family regulatory protein